jgi:GNAT superfamily N-acetyltransferase
MRRRHSSTAVVDVRLVGYRPGAIGRVVELHATYYHKHWGLGLVFEAKIAAELAEFMTQRDSVRDNLWLADVGGTLVGSVAIKSEKKSGDEARLRWFIVEPHHQGQGVGQRLLTAALAHCRRRGIRRVWLTTFAGLDTARRLYEKAGFRLVSQRRSGEWGKTVIEQRFEIDL